MRALPELNVRVCVQALRADMAGLRSDLQTGLEPLADVKRMLQSVCTPKQAPVRELNTDALDPPSPTTPSPEDAMPKQGWKH